MAVTGGLPLGVRIGLLLVAAVLPLATLGAVYAWTAGETAREAEMRARYETARVVAGLVEAVSEGAARATDITLAIDGVATDPNRCRTALTRLMDLVDKIADASILSGGERVCGLVRTGTGLQPVTGTVLSLAPRPDAVMAIGAGDRPSIRIVRTRPAGPGPIALIHVALDPIWQRIATSVAGLGRSRVFLLTEAGGVIADPEGVVETAEISAVVAAVNNVSAGGLPVVQVNAPGAGYVAIARVAETNVRVAVTSDVSAITPPLPVRIALVAGLPFLFLVAAVAIAWFGVDRLVNRWVRRLGRVTRHYGEGALSERVGALHNAPEEFRQFGESFDTMAARIEVRSADLERALAEKNHFVRELHHRVKNNFQMIASLLTLQRREADAATEVAIREAHDRVQALAAAYRASYADGETGQVPIASLMVDLVERLRESADLTGRSVTMEEMGEGMALHLDRAIPFALLMTELLVPVFDRAHTSDDTVRISVAWLDETRTRFCASIVTGHDDVTVTRPLSERLARAYAAQLGADVRREGHRIDVTLEP
ncbi:sensor histidine kinase [Mongoliimonas terrestris]|uniref:sensor histidine kinase n=1 Tax=Mongoliimonas terrestris TaxID=1709001 RepID=UPI0009497D28|nr:sensor histidine kinase [Mongoliimonas terrestris]